MTNHRCHIVSVLTHSIGQAAIRPIQVQGDGEWQGSRGACAEEDTIATIFGERDLPRSLPWAPDLLRKVLRLF